MKLSMKLLVLLFGAVSAAPLVASNTIVDLAVANPELSTLVAALKAGELVDTLSGPGPFTVFAPTNEAFAELPKGLVAALLEPKNKKFLDDILTYHVVAGDVHTKDLKQGTQYFKSVEGNHVKVVKDEDSVSINGALVTSADLDASNGVVHVIDKVLIPPGFVPPSASSLVASKTIVDLAVATPDLATLVVALKAGELVDTLSGPRPFTVFAPTNEASSTGPANVYNPHNGVLVHWSRDTANCYHHDPPGPESGNVTIVPGSGGANGQLVASCDGYGGGYPINLYCQVTVTAATSGSAGALSLQAHYTVGIGNSVHDDGGDDGPVVHRGCSTVMISGKPYPDGGQCCFA